MKNNRKTVITISGPSGSGKSTLAKHIARVLADAGVTVTQVTDDPSYRRSGHVVPVSEWETSPHIRDFNTSIQIID